jgi:hypothetical protein
LNALLESVIAQVLAAETLHCHTANLILQNTVVLAYYNGMLAWTYSWLTS